MAEPTLHEFTASDGYVWRYRRYLPPGSSISTIVALHGIQSHGGWYGQSCVRLAAAGHTVSFLDRRGCGLNQQDRGDAPSIRRLLDDVAEFIQQQPRPVFLLGISWGGKLAVAFPRRHPGLVDGLILVAPGLCSKVRPGFWERCRILAARIIRPRMLFPIPLNEPSIFTSNTDRQKFIRDDPLALRAATARMLVASARLDWHIRMPIRRLPLPVLLLLAESDRIIDNEATSRFLHRATAGQHKTNVYPGASHTLEFEPGGPPFVGDLLNWLACVP